MARLRRILILGGTAEARNLAGSLVDDARVRVVTSLAGRTKAPAAPPGELRIGGFGGIGGLARFLDDDAIDFVIDATHPFAARISRNTAAACDAAGVPRLVLQRPAWTPQAGDRWIEVSDTWAAAEALRTQGKRVFLSLGRQDLAPFASLTAHWFLLRLVDPPNEALPLTACQVVVARGPFEEPAEIELLERHRIDVLVSRNSGGDATYAKLAAARALGLPVIMIARPVVPDGETVGSVPEARAWLERRLAANPA